MKLIICGNGFDLHHDFNTRYCEYKKYLMSGSFKLTRDAELYKIFETCPFLIQPVEEDWSNVEKALKLDLEKFLKCYVDAFHPKKRVNPCSPNYENELAENFARASACNMDFFRRIHEFVGIHYYDWLRNVDFSSPAGILPLDKNDLYITFNYTDTLESVYGIPQTNILYIHGRLNSIGEELSLPPFYEKTGFGIVDNRSGLIHEVIQFGSPDNINKTLKSDLKCRFKDYKINRKFYSDMIDEVDFYCRWAGKDIPSNLKALRSFISGRNIDEIHIMGHSLLSVDDLYYEKVLVLQFKCCKWIIYCFNDEATQQAQEFADKYKINFEARSW